MLPIRVSLRPVVAYCLLAPICTPAVSARSKLAFSSLTILFQYESPHSEKSAAEMKRELGSIMKDSGFEIIWRERGDAATSTFPNLIVVEFKGTCRMQPAQYLYDERGPLALTFSTGDSVLPFSEIECDKVRQSVRNTMTGSDYGRSDQLFGRAVARVLAHELYHVLSGTKSHAEKGVAQRGLSGAQLISDKLQLTGDELKQMRSAAAAKSPR